MGKRYSDELRARMIAWYVEEDERSILDVAFEFGASQPFVANLVKEAGVSKSPYRNKNKNRPASEGNRRKSSNRENIVRVSTKAQYRGHRRRSKGI